MANKEKTMGAVKIYILHGWTYSIEKWNDFASILRSRNIEPVFLNVPGLTEKSDKVWDLDKYTEWLNKKISEKAIILGHSNGGRIALSFAFKYPDKVKKLILVDSAGIYHNNPALQIKRFVFGNAAKIGKKFTDSSSLRKFLYKLAKEKDYVEATPEMKASMVNLINTDLTPKLTMIKCPTLIVWGEKDGITPLNDAYVFKKLIPDSDLEIIKNARHSPFFTHPKEVVEIIENGI